MLQSPELLPPLRFGTVETNLYRGAYPTLKNFRFLRRYFIILVINRLKLTCIVSLIENDPSADLIQFCSCERININHINVTFVKDEIAFTSKTMTQILELISDPANLPLYLHCEDGTHITGLVIMCLRRLQGWTSESYISEYLRYVPSRKIEEFEKSFLKSYTGPIHVQEKYPSWLADSDADILSRPISVKLPQKNLPPPALIGSSTNPSDETESRTLKALTLVE